MMMTEKSWTTNTGEAANYIFSTNALNSLQFDIENGYLDKQDGFCDCDHMDTWWDITDIKETSESVSITVKTEYEEYILIYS